jgi:hypothetical protein
MNRTRRWTRAAPWLGAVAGFAVGVVLSRTVSMAAKPGQLPGIAATLGFDPRGYLWRLVLLVVCPLVGGFVATLLARSTLPEEGNSDTASSSGTGLFLAASAAHAITAWTFLVSSSLARGVSPPWLLVGLLVVSGSLAAVLGRGNLGRGATFLSAGSLVLPLAFWEERPGRIDAAAFAGVLLLPVLGWLFFRKRGEAGRFLRALTLVVLLPGSVTALSAATKMGTGSIANLFEDGHGLLPASEYLRGELPYRDVVPGHGLVADGLLQTAGLRVFGDDYRGLHRTEMVVGAVFWPSLYALAYAATGSPAAAFGALLLSFLSFPQHGFFRVLPCFWVLALALRASRTADRRLWLACGALIPIALLVAVEFAAYAAGAVLVALWVAKGSRLRHLRGLAAGAAASGAVIAVAFTTKGILIGFVETTFFYLPTLVPAYGIPLVRPALPEPSPAGVAAFLADPTMFLYAFVTLAVLVLGAVLPRGARVGDRARATLPILAWVVFAMVSVVERRHVRYPMFLVPLALALLALWLKGARRWTSPRGLAAAAALFSVVLLWKPSDLARELAFALANRQSPPALATFDRPLRMRGALFPPADAALVRATSALIERAKLSPTDTWLDFANASGLHYLFERDCPTRFLDVPFYESEAAQEEVIAAVERNPKVRAALVRSGLPSDPMDGVPNAVRAPKVAKFLELNFEPFLRQDGVEFWLRRPSGP